MNRRERRTAEKQRQSKRSNEDTLGLAPETHPFSPVELGVIPNTLFPASDAAPQLPAKQRGPKFLIRVLAKILLSDWVLKRVQHPDAERLLMSFATEVGRPEVVDELVRRQSMRR